MHFLEQIIQNTHTKKSRLVIHVFKSSELLNPLQLHFVFHVEARNRPLELILVHYVSHKIPVLHEAGTKLH